MTPTSSSLLDSVFSEDSNRSQEMIDIQEKYTSQTHVELPLPKSNMLTTPKAQAKAEQKLKTNRKQCNFCRKISNTSSRCSRCKSTYYCSRACQSKDWATHKVDCGKIMERKKK